MKNSLISIIVPIYNSEKYLEECLESIINQNYTNFELILINDGSNDNSTNICEAYKKIDSRITVIHKENGGVSSARNYGLKIATGEYICFIDSDDYITFDYLIELIENMQNLDTDLVIQGNPNTDIYSSYLNHPHLVDANDYEILFNQLKTIYNGFLHCKLLKREIIEEHRLKLNDEIHFCEDLLFLLEYIKYCKNIYYTPTIGKYFYRKVEGSLVTRINTVNSEFKTFIYYNDIIINKYKISSYTHFPDINTYYFVFLYRTLFAMYQDKISKKTRLEYLNKIIEYSLNQEISLTNLNVPLKILYTLLFNRKLFLFDILFKKYLSSKNIYKSYK